MGWGWRVVRYDAVGWMGGWVDRVGGWMGRVGWKGG